MYEGFWSPAGYYVVLRRSIEHPDYWIVRVLDFATWKHKPQVEFEDEAAARRYADLWRI